MENIRVGCVLANREAELTGINKYTKDVLYNLKKSKADLELKILGDNFLNLEIDEQYGIYTKLPLSKQRQKEIFAQTVYENLNILHSFFYPIPEKKITKILTIYDLSPLVNPAWFADGAMFQLFDKEVRRAALTADAIITISESSKNEIVSYYGVHEEKIRIICPAANCLPACGQIVHNVQEKYGIQGEYLLSIGTLQPRKNIKTLIQAYCLYRKNHADSNIKLVLTGQKGWKYREIFEEAGLGNYIEDIIFTGYVSDGELSALYSQALAFAYISFYEGFGIPILEALAHKKAVLSSNTTSMPEVGADAVVYCDPYDLESVYESLSVLLEDKSLREKLESKAEKQASQFSYEAAADKTYQLYKELA